MVTSIAGGIDHKATPEQIEHIATLIPDEWLEPSATGSAQQCVDRVRAEFDHGADAVIMHGATPDELEPTSPPTAPAVSREPRACMSVQRHAVTGVQLRRLEPRTVSQSIARCRFSFR